MNNVMSQEHGSCWSFYNSDCVEFAKQMPDNSIDFSVYSPPFSSLYVYSESVADMGNVGSDAEFIEQYRYLVREKFRATRPGRLTAIHVKDLVYYQGSSERGTSGLRPFSDMCTQLHIEEGWDFHCRITIWRDPVMERSKTNAHGLLWKTFQKDSSFCRVGMPEYLLVFRKWATEGEEELVRPVLHPKDKVPLICWQELASELWPDSMPTAWNYQRMQSGKGDYDMPTTDVLNVRLSRDPDSEKHLCPMPLNITKRALALWTNEGDVVFSPFGGIGSEGMASITMKRKFIGTELHPTYYREAIKHLQSTDKSGVQDDLFEVLGIES